MPELLDVLVDMFLHSTFDAVELGKEREVIKEELAMYLDQPHQHVQELLNATMWPGQALGRSITGTVKTLDAMSRDALLDYQKTNYVTDAVVITAAGRLNHAQLVRAVKPYSRQFRPGARPNYVPAASSQTRPSVCLHTKKTEQTQLALGIRACSRHDPRRFALRVLNAVLGENMSSRLFQTVREDHGLAYSIYSANSFFDDTGDMVVSAGLDLDNLKKALRIILREMRRLTEQTVPGAELQRAADYLAGQIDLSLENSENQMMWVGEQWLGYGKIIPPAQVKRRLGEVRAGEIRAIARDLFRPERFTLALVTPTFMRPILQRIQTQHTPESLVEGLGGEHGVVLLRSGSFDSPQARYSFVAARPFLTFRSFGSRCGLDAPHPTQFGNPWQVLDALMSRYELLDEIDLPFPLGGCFGFWGYDLKNFVEPKLPRKAINDLELPDCQTGFYDSLVVFDHRIDEVWIISTGLQADGMRDPARASAQLEFWKEHLQASPAAPRSGHSPAPSILPVASNLTRAEFIAKVERAREYIRTGDIYQVNLSHRLTAHSGMSGWEFFEHLSDVSPAPFAAFMDCGDFQICSSSPELFLRLSGRHIQTRPIKGTRPRGGDATRDAQLTYELQTSAKEMAELVMITDLLRNDLGKVCEYGSVQVPELVRLERYAHVQHLVSTVTGRLREDQTHFSAFASCFPGGSVTGAPKIRAMEIIDELEPLTRGPYTGAIGYLGFNRESQLSIAIRSAVCQPGAVHFNVGAGIVAESVAEAEYDETMAKAGGFFAALRQESLIPIPA